MKDTYELEQELDDARKTAINLRREIRQLTDINKRRTSELTYWQNIAGDRQRRIEYLEKHATEQYEIIDRGYKQNDTFSKEHSGIYLITNKKTGEKYVGQSSINVTDRCLSHFKYDEKYTQDDWHYDLQHNPDDYEYKIICEGVPNQGTLDRLEIYFIGKYDCMDHGYNRTIQPKFKFLEGFYK